MSEDQDPLPASVPIHPHARGQLSLEMDTLDPLVWLCDHAPGFAALTETERQAIFHFSLLWSLFEARALDTRASAHAILTLTRRWGSSGCLTVAHFARSLAHFRARYVEQDRPTQRFKDLAFRKRDKQELVLSVLQGETREPTDTVAAVLIVVLRLRNNLFHGLKWAYGIHGQQENFAHASLALMGALAIQNRYVMGV